MTSRSSQPAEREVQEENDSEPPSGVRAVALPALPPGPVPARRRVIPRAMATPVLRVAEVPPPPPSSSKGLPSLVTTAQNWPLVDVGRLPRVAEKGTAPLGRPRADSIDVELEFEDPIDPPAKAGQILILLPQPSSQQTSAKAVVPRKLAPLRAATPRPVVSPPSQSVSLARDQAVRRARLASAFIVVLFAATAAVLTVFLSR